MNDALAELAENLENATARLRATIECVGDGLDTFIDHLEELVDVDEVVVGEERTDQDVLTTTSVVVAVPDIDIARAMHDAMGEKIKAVFEDYNWRVARAMRNYKQALVREDAP